MKTLPWLLFAVMVLVQWAAPLHQVLQHEQVLAQGELVRFKCQAPDPFDPLRGRYLNVAVENTTAPEADLKDLRENQEVYAEVKVGADGMASFGRVTSTPPSEGLYLQCRLPGYIYSPVSLKLPFDRYYLNEDMAPAADAWLASVQRDRTKPTWVEVRLFQGKAVIVDIKHDGQSVKDAIRTGVQ
ncbi:MAG: hypothetical protein JWO08_542 [Verrucomicrobiaceae bacterium]|nr:hypothetical protein [Verrucomicrobiaceae bacterium]